MASELALGFAGFGRSRGGFNLGEDLSDKYQPFNPPGAPPLPPTAPGGSSPGSGGDGGGSSPVPAPGSGGVSPGNTGVVLPGGAVGSAPRRVLAKRVLNFHFTGPSAVGSAVSELRVFGPIPHPFRISSLAIQPLGGVTVGQYVDVLVGDDGDTSDTATPLGTSLLQTVVGAGVPTPDATRGIQVPTESFAVGGVYETERRQQFIKVRAFFVAPAAAVPVVSVLLVVEMLDEGGVAEVPVPRSLPSGGLVTVSRDEPALPGTASKVGTPYVSRVYAPVEELVSRAAATTGGESAATLQPSVGYLNALGLVEFSKL